MGKKDKKPKALPDTTITRDLPAPEGMPSTIKLLGATYRICYRTPLVRASGDSLYGMVNTYDRTILIDPTSPAHVVYQTLLHEIAHVYIESAGIETRLGKARLLETVCDLFGAAVADLLENNPWPAR